MGISRSAVGVEIVWSGKYADDGTRAPLPTPGALPRLEERLPAVASVVEGGEPASLETDGQLIQGENLAVLASFAADRPASIDLMYIDPPFNTGSRFSVRRTVGEQEGSIEVPAYSDAWEGGAAGFLSMLDPRLRLMHQLLAENGSLYVHVDPTIGHAVKILLDEIFGPGCFQREIVWRIGWLSGFKTGARNWIRNHDLIFFYVKNPRRFTFNKMYTPYPEGYLRRDGKPPTGKGFPLDDVWNANEAEFGLASRDSLDSIQIKSFSREKTGWATQKNESILRRIVQVSSNPGDLVADFFCGSGTTAAAAQDLGRRWIVCDSSPVAVQITRARLLDLGARFDLLSDGDGSQSETHGLLFDVRLGPQGCLKIRVWVEGIRWIPLPISSVDSVASVATTEMEQRLRALSDGGVAGDSLVEAWAVTSEEDPETVLYEAHRGHRDRTLKLESPDFSFPEGCRGLRIVVWDLCGQRSVQRVSLSEHFGEATKGIS